MISLSSIRRVVQHELKWRRHFKGLLSDPVLADVITHGFHVTPGYWSDAQCEIARHEIDKMLKTEEVHVWADPLNADRRIMGANNLSAKTDLFSDTNIFDYICRLYGNPQLNGFSMGSKITNREGNLGSGQGWHRDSAIHYQFKAILYLTDVNEHNGPFQYLKQSGHGKAMLDIENAIGLKPDSTRLTEQQVKVLQNRYYLEELQGKAGTLILANTRGVHRGKPLKKGNRYALTNYYWPHAVPKHIIGFVNQ